MRVLIFIMGILGLSSCASNQQEQTTTSAVENIEKETIILKGIMDMRGSSRISFLAITDTKSGIQYKIQNPKKFSLNSKKNHTLTLKAKLLKEAIGAGFPAEIEVIEVY